MNPSSKIIIKCAECGLPLSPVLQRLPEHTLLNFKEKENLLPQGFFTFYKNIEWEWRGLFPPKTTPKSVVINLSDLFNTQNHTDPERIRGCCGLSGGLPNKMCLNHHEIGTEFSDCIMAHCIIFEENQVEIITDEVLKGRNYSEIQILEIVSAYQQKNIQKKPAVFSASFYEIEGGKNYWLIEQNEEQTNDTTSVFYTISDQTGEILGVM